MYFSICIQSKLGACKFGLRSFSGGPHTLDQKWSSPSAVDTMNELTNMTSIFVVQVYFKNQIESSVVESIWVRVGSAVRDPLDFNSQDFFRPHQMI
mmetsp:Transcript_16857/g.34918  ORF Transcript_16857/g.34918 Transcript_16857/m.34918 type:complete len:96 (+) Transcript_16857:732-1019(+)